MKHIYLIMAHDQPKILNLMVRILKQDERNDILVHIDKKVKGEKYVELESAVIPYGAKICPIRKNVYWGDFSQIEAEMALFEVAIEGGYDYYHLLSGSDLPLKPVKVIDDFFEDHPNLIFLRCLPDISVHQQRIVFCTNYYHFMRMRSIPFLGKLWTKCHFDKIICLFEKCIGVNRIGKDDFKMYKGDQWGSLPHGAVEYLLRKKEFIYQRFRNTCCCDEIYKQTVLMNTFRTSFYKPEKINQNASLRLIDWERGYPYIWRINDLNQLLTSNCLFARKFSWMVDEKIINAIYDYVMRE